MPIGRLTDQVCNDPSIQPELIEGPFINAIAPDLEVDMIAAQHILIYGRE